VVAGDEFLLTDPIEEFERQLDSLVEKGYPELAQRSEREFRKIVEPLRDDVERLAASGASPNGVIPFVVAVKSELVPAARSLQLIEREGKAAFAVMNEEDIGSFGPIDEIDLPECGAYLVTALDTGSDMLNVKPDDALKAIGKRRRSPLTIDEGIALATHHPHLVAKGAGFSLLGSRCGDKRVTALWISQGKPKLGWCWAGNPHTWLGSASCGARVPA